MDKNFFGFNYFINQIGFLNKDFEHSYSKILRAQNPPWDKNWWTPIQEEFNIKHNREIIRKEVDIKIVSASDLANYTFCPASFAISKSFDIKPNNKAKIGTSFHKRSRLIYQSYLKKGSQGVSSYYSDLDESLESKSMWNDLKGSTVSYLGHSEEGKDTYFFDKRRMIVSQPDYIFSNKLGQNFVVEEKFFFESRYNNKEPIFHNSHKIQLATYIHGINEINIDYGYLLYWKYSSNYKISYNNRSYIDNEDPYIITGMAVTRINKSNLWKPVLNNTFTKVKNLISSGTEVFDPSSLRPNKCANCAVSSYCGHKTGRFVELDIKYPDRYLTLQPSSIPKQYIHPEPDWSQGI
jgi:CRISPR/Cas system-associated exonuclease Cas4 (RecB family)